jgi:hypothetical protein
MAFRQSIGSFSDLSVNKRLESVNSFLKEIDSVLIFKRYDQFIPKMESALKMPVATKPQYHADFFKS